MKVLPDECLPRKLKRELRGYDVTTIPENGWAGIKNGPLMRLILQSGFKVFVTIDGNLEHQQNLYAMKIALVVLSALDNTFETLQPLMPKVFEALKTIKAGEIVHITV